MRLTATRTKITIPSEMSTSHSTKENIIKKPSHQVEKYNNIENKSVISRLSKVLYILLISTISIRYNFTEFVLCKLRKQKMET